MLDQLLKRLAIEVKSFAVCEVRRGGPLETPPLGSVSLHYVLRGEGRLRDRSNRLLPLAPGSLVICPPHQRLTVNETQGVPFQLPYCGPVSDGLERLGRQRDERLPGVLILCGMLDVTIPELAGSPFDRLQVPVQIASKAEVVASLFEALFEELTIQALGSQAMIDALMKQCLVLLFRELETDSMQLDWLLTLQDPALGAAVSAMTEDVGNRISIEELAAHCHMSRTAFIGRFKRTYGMPPQRFLAERRLRQARHLLVTTTLPIKQVALCCAYRSRSQFSAAFKSRFGQSPERYRHDPQDESD